MSSHPSTSSAQQPHPAPQPTPVQQHTPAHGNALSQATSPPPPSRQALRSWWGKFKKTTEGSKLNEAAPERPTGIFGVPLRQSITYANVAISLVDAEGKSYIYGYVPIIVAKCGVYLKEKATNVEGIFRLSGSEKRIKELRAIFDSPERYGKGLDWDGYTVHDAANVLRRYLNQLPEPIVPLDLYERFRAPLRGHTFQVVGDHEASQVSDEFDLERTIKTYQKLITELPPLNIQLLLYILDLLAVFASKADENRMTSQNLAAIFQPGLLSHPQHDMAPAEYRLSQDVIVFLIENQDHFLIGMRGTAADEKTVQDVQNGTPPVSTPSTPNPNRGKNSLGRSASNASAGADSLRRGGGIRRNVSVNSHHSRQSNGAPSPASPAYGTPLPHNSGGGVHRSNTVPSKKSPALPSTRLQRSPDNSSPTMSAFASVNAATTTTPLGFATAIQESENSTHSDSPHYQSTAIGSSSLTPSVPAALAERSQERLIDTQDGKLDTPTKSSGFPSLFNRSPNAETEKKQPNKLRKKRIPGSSNPSAQSSTNSLVGSAGPRSPGVIASADTHDVLEHTPLETITSQNPIVEHTGPSPPPLAQDQQQPILAESGAHLFARPEVSHQSSDGTLKPQPSSNSLRSGDVSATDQSDLEPSDDPFIVAEQKEKRRRWRLSRKREDSASGNYLTSPKKSNGAEQSTSSFGSGKPRKSFTGDSQPPLTGSEPGLAHATQTGFSDSSAKEEKKGPLGWIKEKMREAKEDKRARDAEKEQGSAKIGSHSEPSTSSAALPARGKSMDMRRDGEPVSSGAAIPTPGNSLTAPTTIPPTVVEPPSASPPFATEQVATLVQAPVSAPDPLADSNQASSPTESQATKLERQPKESAAST